MWSSDPAYRLSWFRSPDEPLTVRWEGYLRNGSGYGEEGRGYAFGLARRGWDLGVATAGDDPDFVAALAPRDRRTLQQALDKGARPGDVVVENVVPTLMGRRSVGRYHVGRTMFETAGLPEAWLGAISQMDEVWVPTEFSVGAFRAAGVRVPVHVVPAGVDERLYRPGARPHPVGAEAGRVFLAVSAVGSDSRSGWDVLLDAWARAFGPTDDVVLVLKISPPPGAGDRTRREFDAWIESTLQAQGHRRDRCARILVLTDLIAPADVPGLYAAATALVAPLRGTAFGRPLVEAMACEVPVVATAWSAITDIVTPRTGFLIEVESLVTVPDDEPVAVYRGQTWAQPSSADLARHLRDLADGAADDGAVGRRGRQDVLARWTWDVALDVVEERLRDIDDRTLRRTPPRPAPAPVLRWEGDQYQVHSLAQVNREVSRQLAGADVDLALDLSSREVDPDPQVVALTTHAQRAATGAGGVRPADVTVRHQWPPDWTPPASGTWVVVQPWEFGAVPLSWIMGAGQADEIWCYTTWVRDAWAMGGFPLERLRVVPLGVDADLFTPDGPRREFSTGTGSGVRFLFCGGAITRKGIDVLLEAYLEEFGADDDVHLVVKAHGSRSHYAGSTILTRLWEASRDPSGPAVEVIDEDLEAADLAALYRACDVLVHPYRGEGFGLPVLEAMSTGLPVVVTAGAATSDFCDASNAWLVDAELVPVEVDAGPSSAAYFWAEPDRASLRRCLRAAFEDGEGRQGRGRNGRDRAVREFTWAHTAEAVLAAVGDLAHQVPVRERPQPALDTRSADTFLHEPRRPLAADALLTSYLTSADPAAGTCLVLAVPPEEVGAVAAEFDELIARGSGTGGPAPAGEQPEVLLVPCPGGDLTALRELTRWSSDDPDAPGPPDFRPVRTTHDEARRSVS